MEIIPAARAARYEQLEPGELFYFMEGSTYALKTQHQAEGDRNKMVLLGPSFLDGGGPFLLEWQAATVISFGKNCAIFLTTSPAAWAPRPLNRSQVWLAIAEERTFICTNGGPTPQHYLACFVDIKTGEIVEQGLRDSVVYTNAWEIAMLGVNHPPRTILKYPLSDGG